MLEVFHRSRRPARRRRSATLFRPAVDRLESRIALAIDTLSIGVEQAGTFTDADGDVLGVFISGASGTVVFRNSSGDPVADGDDIASVTITGASKDFDLSFTTVTAGGAGNAVALGAISASTPIRGIYTVTDATDAVVYNLTSFTGPGFGKRGGLFVDNVVDGGAITVTGGLVAGSVIDVRNALGSSTGATLTVGSSATTTLAGRVFVRRGPETSSIVLDGPAVKSFEIVAGINNGFNGAITANRAFDGQMTNWFTQRGFQFNGGFGPNALLNLRGGRTYSIGVVGDLAGQIVSSTSNVSVDVSGSVLSTGRLVSGYGLSLTTGGDVAAGARLFADSQATLDIDGSFAGSLSVSGDTTMRVGRDLTAAEVLAQRDLTLTVEGSVTKGSLIDTGDDTTLAISGNFDRRSRLVTMYGSVTGFINGAVNDASLMAAGYSESLTLSIGGSVRNATFASSANMSLDVNGSVTRSRFTTHDRRCTLDIGGSFTKSTIAGSNDFTVITGDSALDNDFSADGNSSTLDIGGDFRGRFAGYGMQATVDGSVLRGSEFLFEDNGTFDIGRNFAGTIMTGEFVSFQVGGNVESAARIQVGQFQSFGGAEQSFYVGGDFSGRVQAGRMDAVSGAVIGRPVTLVEGNLTKRGRITIGGFANENDGESYVFGGNLDGVLTIGGDLNRDLTIAGRANVITIGGSVFAEIVVGGGLQSLTTGGSLFVYGGPTSGIFITGAGESGSLSVGRFNRGARTVRPVLLT